MPLEDSFLPVCAEGWRFSQRRYRAGLQAVRAPIPRRYRLLPRLAAVGQRGGNCRVLCATSKRRPIQSRTTNSNSFARRPSCYQSTFIRRHCGCREQSACRPAVADSPGRIRIRGRASCHSAQLQRVLHARGGDRQHHGPIACGVGFHGELSLEQSLQTKLLCPASLVADDEERKVPRAEQGEFRKFVLRKQHMERDRHVPHPPPSDHGAAMRSGPPSRRLLEKTTSPLSRSTTWAQPALSRPPSPVHCPSVTLKTRSNQPPVGSRTDQRPPCRPHPPTVLARAGTPSR